MAIANILQIHAQTQPNALAIIDARYRRSLTFAELEQTSAQIAAQLAQAGLGPGEAALIFQPMSARLYEILLALFRLGAIAMFVDPQQGNTFGALLCPVSPTSIDCDCKGAFAATAIGFVVGEPSGLGQIALNFSTDRWILGAELLGEKCPASRFYEGVSPEIQDSAPALLTFTSGSTGEPKAALRTHGFLLAQHRALAHSLQLTAGEIDLATLPIFVLANLASGVTSLIPDVDLRYPGKINPANVMRHIQQQQPSSVAASPALLGRLVAYCDRHTLQLPSFKRIFSGGAPVFPKLLQRLQAIAPQAQVTAVYGSTEAEPMAHIAYREIQAEDFVAISQGGGLLTGQPVPEIQLRILSHPWGTPVGSLTQADFEARCLDWGAIGEIVVSGEHVLPGYWHGTGDEATKFRVDGFPWHRTGDAGYLDQQGRLWLLGRCSATIQDEQGTLYPFAVEAAASNLPGIRRTAMVLHNNRRLLLVEGDRLSDTTLDATLKTLNTTLAWAHIDEFKLYRHIPVDKRHNAKIDYPALYRQLQQP